MPALIRVPVVRPMFADWFIDFLSRVKLDQDSAKKITKAFLVYHETCAKAAKKLEADLAACEAPEVNIKKPKSKK